MSPENVEAVQAVLAEFATTHRAGSRLLTPDFVWEMATFRGWPDTQTYVGAEGFDAFFREWTGPYDDWDMEVRDIREVAGDRVVAIVTQRGRLNETDSWVELQYGLVYR